MSFTAEEERILRLLKQKIIDCGGDDLQYFQTCYFKKYQKHHDCVTDVCNYRLHAIVPRYVLQYQ